MSDLAEGVMVFRHDILVICEWIPDFLNVTRQISVIQKKLEIKKTVNI